MCNGVLLFIANNHNDFLEKKWILHSLLQSQFPIGIVRQVVWVHVIIISFFGF